MHNILWCVSKTCGNKYCFSLVSCSHATCSCFHNSWQCLQSVRLLSDDCQFCELPNFGNGTMTFGFTTEYLPSSLNSLTLANASLALSASSTLWSFLITEIQFSWAHPCSPRLCLLCLQEQTLGFPDVELLQELSKLCWSSFPEIRDVSMLSNLWCRLDV